MEKPVTRILQINAGNKNFGGVSSFLYHVYQNIDTSKYQFDFLSPSFTTYSLYRKDLESRGAFIYELGIKGGVFKRKFLLKKRLYDFLLKNKYPVVHINSGNFFFNIYAASAAKKAGVKHIIIHSHNSAAAQSKIKNFIIKQNRKRLAAMGEVLCACSKQAAEFMFPNNADVKLIRNGIDTDRFAYREAVRTSVREKLHFGDRLVVGNIARFTKQKNHPFMIDVFETLLKYKNDAVLYLVGEGEDEDTIKNIVKKRGLDKNVIFAGVQKNIEELYQAFDVFFLPSLYEGLGIVNIEAQTSGLGCVVSDSIPDEADISGKLIRLPLSAGTDVWAKELIRVSKLPRTDGSGLAKKYGYDEKVTTKQLCEIYDGILKNQR